MNEGAGTGVRSSQNGGGFQIIPKSLNASLFCCVLSGLVAAAVSSVAGKTSVSSCCCVCAAVKTHTHTHEHTQEQTAASMLSLSKLGLYIIGLVLITKTLRCIADIRYCSHMSSWHVHVKKKIHFITHFSHGRGYTFLMRHDKSKQMLMLLHKSVQGF